MTMVVNLASPVVFYHPQKIPCQLAVQFEAEHAENWLTDDSGLQPTGDNWRPTNGQSGSLFDVKLRKNTQK